MYHYVYLLEFTNGKKYVGARSRKFKPELDVNYLGSGRDLPVNRTTKTCKKTILSTFNSRKQAIQAEIEYIDKHNCCDSPIYYNKRRKTTDRYGHTKEVCGGSAASSQKQRGRSKATHPYLKEKGIAFKKYTGSNRTPALLDADKRRGETIRGTKNKAKGRSGVINNGFTPWYYITPEGDYHEIYSITRQEFAARIGLTARQIGHRFHYTNMHKPCISHVCRGWVFGTLPKP